MRFTSTCANNYPDVCCENTINHSIHPYFTGLWGIFTELFRNKHEAPPPESELNVLFIKCFMLPGLLGAEIFNLRIIKL